MMQDTYRFRRRTEPPDTPQPMPGNTYTDDVGPEGMNPGGLSDSGGAGQPPTQFPVDRNRPFLPDREGIDRTNDLLQPRDEQDNPLPLSPVPPNNGQIEYDDQGNPHWVGGTNYQDYQRERAAGTMYRLPAQQPDEVHQGIMDYMQHQQMSPEQKRADWIKQNVWSRGLTVDMGTGEIIDPDSGQPVARLPRFD